MEDAKEIDRLFREANELSGQQRHEEASRLYERVVAARPDHASALNNLGFCLHQLGRHDEAVFQLQRALAAKPDFPLALANLVGALEASKRRFEAIPYRRRLVNLEPHSAKHCFHLAQSLVSSGRVEECLFYLRQALELAPGYRDAAANYLLYLHYSDRETPESIALEHFRLARLWRDARPRREMVPRPSPEGRRLRVGYVAADFYSHPVGKLILPVLEAHDKSKFDVYCYHHGKTDDDWTRRIAAACTEFHHIYGAAADDLFDQIQVDRIDVLMDLGGFTGGGNRLEVFAARAAPVQISYLGYPDTTGLPEIDYRVTDDYCDPVGETERRHGERLVRLQRGFLCYAPPADLPAVVEAPFRRRGHFTFGCFNNIAKLSPSAYAAWAGVLKQVPDARLAFKYGDRYESPAIQERVRSIFAARGVDPARLEFWSARPNLREHLAALGEADVALDAFPYQGTTTTLECLTMSVPVVALQGPTYCRRASSALLARLGLDELIAETADEYVDVAVGLARDRDLLAELRGALRARFFAGEICDAAAHTRELEEIFRNALDE